MEKIGTIAGLADESVCPTLWGVDGVHCCQLGKGLVRPLWLARIRSGTRLRRDISLVSKFRELARRLGPENGCAGRLGASEQGLLAAQRSARLTWRTPEPLPVLTLRKLMPRFAGMRLLSGALLIRIQSQGAGTDTNLIGPDDSLFTLISSECSPGERSGGT